MVERIVRSYIVHCVFVAVLYYIAAKLGLMLTIEPEKASPIFPAAGLALAALLIGGYRLWPGIVLGGMALNIPNFEAWVQAPLLAPAIIGAIVTLGSTVQAVVGAWLIRKFRVWPGLLEKAKDIVLFAALGGPVACLISATVGVVAIAVLGNGSAASLAFKWLSWWIGDSIGVLLFAPLITLCATTAIQPQRKRAIAGGYAVIAFLVCGFFLIINHQSRFTLQQQFQEYAENWYNLIHHRLYDLENDLQATRAFYASSQEVSPEEFKTFISTAVTKQTGLMAIEWVQRVPAAKRSAVEQQMRRQGYKDFKIHKIPGGIHAAPGKPTDDLYPILYVEPAELNQAAFGFDFSSEEKRRQAIFKARDSNDLSISELIAPVQAPEKRGLLIFEPVYKNGAPLSTIEQRRNNFVGVLVSLFNVNEFVDTVLFDSRVHKTIELRIEDVTADEPQLLYGKERPVASLFQWSRNMWVADRVWSLTFYSSDTSLASGLFVNLGIILGVGLCITFVMSTFLLLITGRIEAVQRLVNEKTGEIRAREEMFRIAMQNASIGMALVAPDGKWLKVNKALRELTGYSEAELLKMDFQMLTHPDDLAKDLDFVKQMLAGEIQSYSMEKRYLHKNGGIIWVLLSVTLVYDADGTPKYFISQIQDISNRREVDRMKNEFISTVSHELRTPLTSIRGALGLIVGGVVGKIPEKVEDLIRIAYKNSERLILIINDILDIEKVEAGKLTIFSKPIEISQILQQSVEANQPYGDKYKVKYRVRNKLEGIHILADPDRFMQIMTNLLSNAAKFSPANSEVWVGADLKDGEVVFSVKDHGSGIPEEFRPRMFEKFARADNSDSRRVEGTGLGLRICAKFVEAMNGKIWFETEIGKGTCFYFSLPRAQQDAASPIVVAKEPASAYPVLICDDDKVMAALIQAYLEQAGFETDKAYTLSEARRKLQQNTYSAVTMDVVFPDGNGVDFVQEMRSRPETHDLPVIMISGEAEANKKLINSSMAGIGDWLAKPLDGKRLENRLVQSLKHIISGEYERLPHVLHIEDDSDLSHVVSRALLDRAIVVNATTLKDAGKWLQHSYFDLVVLDIEMPDGSGLEFLKNLKHMVSYPLPVMILSASEVDMETQEKVSAAMVKSRVSENYIVHKILSLVDHPSAANANQEALP